MDFSLTDEQRMLVESLRRFVRTELEPHENLVEELREVPRELAGQIRRKALDRR